MQSQPPAATPMSLPERNRRARAAGIVRRHGARIRDRQLLNPADVALLGGENMPHELTNVRDPPVGVGAKVEEKCLAPLRSEPRLPLSAIPFCVIQQILDR